MKYFKLITFSLIVMICVATVSCDIFEERDRTYQGPTQVELFPLNQILNESKAFDVSVQLIGKQRSEPLQVNFSVDDSSTAVQGQDYTISPSSPVTIPADSSSATIGIQVNNSNIQAGSVHILYLSINGTNANNINPGKNIKTLKLTIRGAQ